MKDMRTSLDFLTEKQLREQEKELTEVLASGEATIDVANRLSKIRSVLRRFDAVKNNQTWDY
jgi:hypothetical protein